MKKTILFEKSFASNEKSQYWCYEKNKINPNEVTISTNKKYWFNCDICKHSFEKILHKIKSGHFCPYCCNHTKILCNNLDCKRCYEKSFASSEKAKYWSSKNELSPRQVFKNCRHFFLFNCDSCNHIIHRTVANVTNSPTLIACNYCSLPTKLLCLDNECNICFDRSFASSDKLKYWSSKNEKNPRQVFKSSTDKYLFDCECGHTIDKALSNITKGSWCPYCCIPQQKICEKDECNSCYEASFASSDKAKYWSSKNELNPRQVSKSSGCKYWFDCENGHTFNIALDVISSTKNGWCSYCVNKTEQKLYDTLINFYIKLKTQFKVNWCMNISYLPYDFVLEENKIIIELDGLQHFKQVSNWVSPEKTHLNDVYKMKCANENGYSVIRLLQLDVLKDKYDWLTELISNIEKIKLEKKIQNIYMCKDDKYDIFQHIK